MSDRSTKPDEDRPAGVRDDIAREYYRTTASRRHSPSEEWYRHSSRQKLRRVRGWLPENRDSSILELACGCGELLYGLESLGYRKLTGVDLCREELDQARSFVSAQLACADVREYLAETAETFDIVVAMNILEHLSKDDLVRVLRQVSERLRAGGRLIVMVPNAVSPFGAVTRYWDISHECAFTTNNWHQLASLCGFSPDVVFRECGPVPHGFVSGLRYLLWRGIRLLIKACLLCETASPRGNIYTQDMMVLLRIPKAAPEEAD